MPFVIVRDDIVHAARTVDAIADPTNSYLRGTGGTDGAIHRAAGPELEEECRQKAPLAPGSAAVTGGYGLGCRYILHTVGPRIGSDGPRLEDRWILESCYRSCLREARKYHCRSVAFPLIAAGTFGYPKHEAMEIARNVIREFLQEEPEMEIRLVVYGREETLISQELFDRVRSYIDDNYVSFPKEERSRYSLADGEERHALRRKAAFETDAREISDARFSISESSEEENADSGDMCSCTDISDAEELCDAAPARMPDAAGAKEIRAPKVCRTPEPELKTSALNILPCLKKKEKIVLDESFLEMLKRKLSESGKTNAEIYEKALLNKAAFSKILSGKTASPKKTTVAALAFALELKRSEMEEMLAKAGYSFTKSSMFDVILMYCLDNRIYDVMQINEILFDYDQQLLGCI